VGELTPLHEKMLREHMQLLEQASAECRSTIADMKLPNGYDDALALMQRQIEAIQNLLDGKPLGFDFTELAYDKSLTAKPHLQNLAELARRSQAMESGAEAYLEQAAAELHKLKGGFTVASITVFTIKQVMQQNLKPTDSAGEGEWKR
jgi:hypothetical protein